MENNSKLAILKIFVLKSICLTRDQKTLLHMIKGSIKIEDITFANIYACNTGAPKYIQKILTDLKGEIDRNTNSVGNLNTPPSPLNRSSR